MATPGYNRSNVFEHLIPNKNFPAHLGTQIDMLLDNKRIASLSRIELFMGPHLLRGTDLYERILKEDDYNVRRTYQHNIQA